MRVASLLPSATEMVHFAGAGGSLVGVTHECDHPPGVQQLPKLTSSKIDPSMTSAEIDAAIGKHLTDTGSIYALDTQLLTELEPDLILTQGLCDVCAVSMDLVEEAASGLNAEPEILSLNPTSLREVLDDTVTIGEALGRAEEARRKVAVLEERLGRLQEAVAELPRPRVGSMEWLDPLFSAGHWVPEIVRIAGGAELFAGEGERSRRLTWQAVFEAAPEVLILMPCGFGVERTIHEARALPDLPGWADLPAVKSGRVWAVDANSYFSRPAPRLVEGVELLGRILHPEVFAEAPGSADAVRLYSAWSKS